MRFLSIYAAAERNHPPAPEEIARMNALIGEGFAEGWLISTEGCLPTSLGARVRQAAGAVSVTDGPFSSLGLTRPWGRGGAAGRTGRRRRRRRPPKPLAHRAPTTRVDFVTPRSTDGYEEALPLSERR